MIEIKSFLNAVFISLDIESFPCIKFLLNLSPVKYSADIFQPELHVKFNVLISQNLMGLHFDLRISREGFGFHCRF